ITGGFALLYGILWAFWAGKEKKAEEKLRQALEARSLKHSPGGFEPREFLLPKDRLTEEAYKRFHGILKWVAIGSLGFAALISIILLFSHALSNPLQPLYLFFFCVVVAVPSVIIQWIIWRKYEASVPQKICLYQGSLVIDGKVFLSQEILNITISPNRIMNINSPMIFREMLVRTSRGETLCRIDYKAGNAAGGQLCWEEYPLFSEALKAWGEANLVPVTIAYME
ncbi:MAG: hypothetical protein IK133_03135, partial [Clostridia bacterium]|nr:hypothetical protein [Clostridia bacterium]